MPNPIRRFTILVVEDDPLVLKTTSDMLERLGYAVITAQSPNEAYAICTDAATAIDLMITDVVMPETSGFQLRDKLMPLRPRLKVLFSSGHPAHIISQASALTRRDHFIQKPFSLKELDSKIKEVIGS
jgi:two-component system cell cycle sensor histidine kinase/response regulator CckA